jgi:hypothetical protein
MFTIHKDYSYNDEERDCLKDGIWDERFVQNQIVLETITWASSLEYYVHQVSYIIKYCTNLTWTSHIHLLGLFDL